MISVSPRETASGKKLEPAFYALREQLDLANSGAAADAANRLFAASYRVLARDQGSSPMPFSSVNQLLPRHVIYQPRRAATLAPRRIINFPDGIFLRGRLSATAIRTCENSAVCSPEQHSSLQLKWRNQPRPRGRSRSERYR
jgi:hypothetical protein